MPRSKRDNVHLLHDVVGDDAIEGPDLPNRRGAILRFLAIFVMTLRYPMALRRPAGIVLDSILTFSHRRPAGEDRKADGKSHPPQTSHPPSLSAPYRSVWQCPAFACVHCCLLVGDVRRHPFSMQVRSLIDGSEAKWYGHIVFCGSLRHRYDAYHF